MITQHNLDSLSALTWLVEAGADEAIGDVPVSRLVAKATPQTHPPLEGGSKNQSASARGFFGEGSNPPASKTYPSPKTASSFSSSAANRGLHPQGEVIKRDAVTPTSVLNPLASDNDHIGRAMEIAAACSSLAELKTALESFEGCTLKKSAINTVFADGNPDARILFIGEAPGFEEDKSGLPFVGKAGKLLDKMLAAIGLDRTVAYIINVLPWQPPENRNLDLTEVAKCLPFLRRHIELHAPELIVLLGGTPLKHVLGITEGVMRTRGKWLGYHVGGRMIPVMPTLHPAYLLRQPAHKKLAWRDLLQVDDKTKGFHLLEPRAPSG
jgi:DNA polymerase